jgi:hypothetical protein
VRVLAAHGVPVDLVLVPAELGPVEVDGVEVVTAEVARANGLAHDPAKLGAALRSLSAR